MCACQAMTTREAQAQCGARTVARPMSLNPQQRAAVEYCDGPLLVLAGAGSGKTRVIVEKIAHLIRQQHLSAAKIAAITFTNKAAREMRERVARRVPGGAAEGLTVCTFHALGLKFLQIEHARAGLRRNFSVFDGDDSQTILKDLLPKGIKPDALFALQSLVSRAKNEGLSPDEARRARDERRASTKRPSFTPITSSASPRSTRSISTI